MAVLEAVDSIVGPGFGKVSVGTGMSVLHAARRMAGKTIMMSTLKDNITLRYFCM